MMDDEKLTINKDVFEALVTVWQAVYDLDIQGDINDQLIAYMLECRNDNEQQIGIADLIGRFHWAMRELPAVPDDIKTIELESFNLDYTERDELAKEYFVSRNEIG